MSRVLTRSQVLAWRENWNIADRELIEYCLDVVGAAEYYEPNSKTYVGARVAGGVAFYVMPGYLYWASPRWTEGLDLEMFPGGLGSNETDPGRWYGLSTFQHRGSPSTLPLDELRAPCPACFLVPSVSGSCGCD